MIHPPGRQTLRRILLVLCVLISLAPCAVYGQAAPSLVWTESLDGYLRHYSPTVDPTLLTSRGLLLYRDEANELYSVEIDGSADLVTTVSIPIPDIDIPMVNLILESANAEKIIVFGEGTSATLDGLIVPIVEAWRYSIGGTLEATYSDVLDEGYLSTDGSVLVSFAGPWAAWAGEPSGRRGEQAKYYGPNGKLVAETIDRGADYTSASMSPDGSLFVYNTGDQYVARNARGELVWSHPLPAGRHPSRAERSIAVSPLGTRTAISTVGDGEVITILDGNGFPISSTTLSTAGRGFSGLRLSADGSRLLSITRSDLKVLDTASGAVVADVVPDEEDFVIHDAVIDHAGSRVVASVRLDSYVDGHPSDEYATQLYVKVVDADTGALLFCIDVPRDDDLVQTREPVTGVAVHLSGDGKYLTLALEKTLWVYYLG